MSVPDEVVKRLARYVEARDGEVVSPLSALQHLLVCLRQCALIHDVQLWAENHLTEKVSIGMLVHSQAR